MLLAFLALQHNFTGHTDIEFHQRMQEVIICELFPCQRISQNTLLPVVYRPSPVEKQGNQSRFQIRVLDVFWITKEGNAKHNQLISLGRDDDLRNKSRQGLSYVASGIWVGPSTDRKMKLKLLTISSRTYSGKLMKASGCAAGNGNLIWVSVLHVRYCNAHSLNSLSRGIIRSTCNSQHEDNDISHELQWSGLH